jgi:hypothetical protein
MQVDTASAAVWERVYAAMREPLRDYVRLVRDVFGKEAQSLTLFGPVVTGGFDPATQTARSALVLERVAMPTLRRLAEHGARLGKVGIAAPLVMTPKYIGASLDSFPLELIEIQQQGAVVFGDDPFAGLTFEDAHVRLQCERELKRALLSLRQGLLATAGRERHVAALEREAADQLLRTLHGLLWLKGRRAFVPTAGVVNETEAITERKLPGLRAALDSSTGAGWKQFDNLYADVEALMEFVDAW